jgi:tRNA nucleotidyltransferase (CCA-adding enzyme)
MTVPRAVWSIAMLDATAILARKICMHAAAHGSMRLSAPAGGRATSSDSMKIYLVGGAVRDRLLGRAVSEKDHVVVGATADDMQARGFKPVGKDFPVFLHPDTGEEYALARTERKSGHGYHGFVFHAEPDVPLEQDLARRDLTINAMAEDETSGELIDPFNGRADLDAGLLRHISDAFVEDPLRVLRVARFAARFHERGFRVADETRALMVTIAERGELDYLTPERVWKETERALREDRPDVYFRVLEDCAALQHVFPELAALRGAPQPGAHQAEVDALVHQLLSLEQAARLELPLAARFAVLVHDLGKATTHASRTPQPIGQESRSAELAQQVAERLRVPGECRDLGVLVARWHTQVHQALELQPGTLWNLLQAVDVRRRPERLEPFLGACEAHARARTGLKNGSWPQGDFLRGAARAVQHVDIAGLRKQGFEGSRLGEAIEQQRIQALKEFKESWLTESS